MSWCRQHLKHVVDGRLIHPGSAVGERSDANGFLHYPDTDLISKAELLPAIPYSPTGHAPTAHYCWIGGLESEGIRRRPPWEL